jgi:hypothetical protein
MTTVVGVCVGVLVGVVVAVGVELAVSVGVGVLVGVAVLVAVSVGVSVGTLVKVGVVVGVSVGMPVGVFVGVLVGVPGATEISPSTVVIPLFDAGGTRSTHEATEYATPPIVTEVTVKLTIPEPELEALNAPLKVAEKLSLPATGTVCVMVRVKVPVAAMTPLPLKNV